MKIVVQLNANASVVFWLKTIFECNLNIGTIWNWVKSAFLIRDCLTLFIIIPKNSIHKRLHYVPTWYLINQDNYKNSKKSIDTKLIS